MSNELTFAQVKPLLYANLKARQTPALLGEAGIGKSSLIEDLAREFKTKVFTLPVNQLADRADLTGVRMTQDEHGNWGQSFFPHTTIMEAISYAERNPNEEPILFLDEFNRASSDITSAILSFQTLRRIGTIDFPDNLRLIVAGNDKGNVTSLDKASITRFAVYRVKPDIDTFLSIQELNPFVERVLTKYPGDLLAPVLMDIIEKDDDDEDDDDDNRFDISSEYLDEDGFEQATVPRTITATSDWLNSMGMDASGSDDEMIVLKSLLAQTSVDDTNDILRIGLMAQAGNTDFTQHLYEEIREHFYQGVNGSIKTQKAVLHKFRPKQDFINDLSKAQDTQDVNALIAGLNDTEKQDAMIWLFETRNVTEVNNNDAVVSAIKELADGISSFDGSHMQGLNAILAQSSSANERSMKTFIETNSASANMYKAFIAATLGI